MNTWEGVEREATTRRGCEAPHEVRRESWPPISFLKPLVSQKYTLGVSSWYRSHEDVERFGAVREAESQLRAKLKCDSELVDEVGKYVLHYANNRQSFYAPHAAKEIAFHSPVELAIRSRVALILRKMEELGLIGLCSSDMSDSTNYREATVDGKLALGDGSYRHLLLGFPFTLRQLKSAVHLIVHELEESSGTCLHLGNGHFLTCAHCVSGGGSTAIVDVSQPESKHEFEVVSTSDELDLALLICQSFVPTAKFKIRPVGPELLENVLVLHFPNVPTLQRTLVATTGEINGRAENYLKGGHEEVLISARTAPGSSGGAVVGSGGFLVGIVRGSGAEVGNTGSSSDEGTWRAEPFYHAIPSDQIGPFIHS